MRLFHQPPAQNLSEWLDIATRDLAPSAQRRIRAEIEGHYAEAVQSRLQDGSSERVAHAAGLADLGNPKAAARRFRRHYLTRKEVRRLTAMFKRDVKNNSVLSYLFLASLFSPGNPTAHLRPSFFHFTLSMTSLLLVVAGVTCIFTRKRAPTLVNRRRNLGIHFLSLLGGGVLTLIEGLATLRPNSNYVLALLVLVAVYAYACYSIFSLRQKLLAARENDFPAPDLLD